MRLGIQWIAVAALILSAAVPVAHADMIADAELQQLQNLHDQAQRNADREASYGSREQARRWQKTADDLQSQIDAKRTMNRSMDQAGQQIMDAFKKYYDKNN